MLTKKEIHRQLFHLCLGLVIVFLIYINVLSSISIFLIIIAGILTSFISKRVRIPIVSSFLDHFERDGVKTSFPGRGAIFFFVGTLLVLELFEKNIAMASIMILALGDSISHLVGARFGEIKNIFNWRGNKLFEGTIAGAIAGFIGALLFVPIPEAFLGSFAAMIAEVVQIDFNEKTIDDNIVVPLVAGTVIFLVYYFL
jgi:phytol kinase